MTYGLSVELLGLWVIDFMGEKMDKQRESKGLIEFIKAHRDMERASFHMPGHKGKDFFKENGYEDFVDLMIDGDLTEIEGADNLFKAESILREIMNRYKAMYTAKHAFMLVGGSSAGILASVLSVISKGDTLIMASNCHKSVYNALMLSGGKAAFVAPETLKDYGLAGEVSASRIEEALIKNPDAKAVLITSPNYYGVCSDIEKISEIVHAHGKILIVDEAHGAHLHFTDKLPISAMDAGADMAAVSMHKSGGSLTQSSLLLIGEQMNPEYVRQIINLTQSTSASYLLMASLDISRRNLALRGKESFEKVIELSEYARREINAIGGYYAYSKELIDGVSVCDFDVTKLSVYTQGIGLTGIEVYDLLRDEYDIQIEFGDIGNILAYISIGDRIQDIERLVGALADIKRLYSRDGKDLIAGEYIQPELVLSPQEAFYSERKSLTLDESVGQVCGEFVMCYPPGIPILAPGERITREIVDYIQFAKERGCSLQGTEDPEVNHINVIKRKEN